jgi:NADH-quinone oxidoreductase subunit N
MGAMNGMLLCVPEMVYGIMALVFGWLSLRSSADGRCKPSGIAIVLALLGFGVSVACMGLTGNAFSGAYRVDRFSQFFKVLLAAGLLMVLWLCRNIEEQTEGIEPKWVPECFLLLTLSTAAMMVMVSAVHLIGIYLSLEVSSYSLYVLVSLRRERSKPIAFALRYFLIGAGASALMLLGLVLLYGFSQSVQTADIAGLSAEKWREPGLMIGMMLFCGGFLFKLAVFPFHFWAPEVYSAAANPIAAYIATASKVAAIALLIRLCSLSAMNAFLSDALAVLAVLTMTVGNLSAIVQKDFKTLLAFSSVAQAGYVLIGVLAMSPDGFAASAFYSVGLLAMKMTCFLVVVKVAANGQNPKIGDLAGLHRKSPILALALMLALFGLAGIPPTIGFSGKLLLFTAAMQQGRFGLVLFAMINVVVSLYYYLQVLKAAYLLDPSPSQPELHLSSGDRILVYGLILVMLVAGFYPEPLLRVATAITAGL